MITLWKNGIIYHWQDEKFFQLVNLIEIMKFEKSGLKFGPYQILCLWEPTVKMLASICGRVLTCDAPEWLSYISIVKRFVLSNLGLTSIPHVYFNTSCLQGKIVMLFMFLCALWAGKNDKKWAISKCTVA